MKIAGSRLRLVIVLVGVIAAGTGAVVLLGDPAERALVQSPRVTGTPAAGETPSPSPEPPHPVSLQALMQKDFDGRDFRVGRVLARTSAYTSYFITFESASYTISGVMNVPRGSGRFPVLIFNHGYIDPAVYVNGQGLRPERDYVARRGYVVVHVDYRNHAQSDDDPRSELTLRLGYAEDVINAILAIQKSSLPYVDAARVGVLGRSMGGGVTFNAAVVRPDLIDAVVVFSSVSSNYVDNFNKWTRTRRVLAERIASRYGSPEDNPAFWRNVSAVNFFDRVDMPILVHHGTADTTTPYVWAERTVSALRAHDKEVDFQTYRGEQHQFGAAWSTAMRRTVAFFDEHLKAG